MRGDSRGRRAAATLALLGLFLRHAPTTDAFAVGASSARPAVRLRSAVLSSASSARLFPAEDGGDDGGGFGDRTSADLDAEVLRRRMQRGDNKAEACVYPEDFILWEHPLNSAWLHPSGAELGSAFVFLYNPGCENEGVYTIQSNDEATYVLCFQDYDDAIRFSQLLEAEDFVKPSICAWSKHILTEFCEEGDFKIGIVPSGVMIMPPRHNYFGLPPDASERNDPFESDAWAGELAGARVNPELLLRLEALFSAECQRPDGEEMK
ncbi:hypothetical protein T492DRAFT_1143305 [Pavlovales sp. CCMP2436]|nr:hypothetical protein T492DRAFT_1143305 [Pavlovales sp. CCMP2436]